MAYVGDPFAYDLFVSYSHGDAEGNGDARLQQWSQGFARELEAELKAYPRFAKSLSIFLDQSLRPSQSVDPLSPLTGQLKADVGGSAMLTVVMTPHYLASGWCRDERDWWHDKQRALEIPVDGRVAVVRAWPTTDSWPGALSDERGNELPGFWFFDRQNAVLLPQPYGWPDRHRSDERFGKELLPLVGRIGLKLDDVRKRVEERRQAREQMSKLAAGGGQVVYLHGRAEYARAWDQAADTLQASGLVVLPAEPDPVVSDSRRLQELRHLRVEAMSGCDALLLLSAPDARAVEADLVVVGRQDRNSARALSNHPLPCALLDTVGGEIATPRRKVTARSLNVEWIDATQPAWPPAVQEWLMNVARQEAPI